ncbi:histidine phosphatase family protein [Actinomadura sp. 21ATH]|uniref:histidine phosphatase family protein n=1 Tax=Actinomadura sp. 21ATH TaxID=1735444 RepID=UPI0035BFFCE9
MIDTAGPRAWLIRHGQSESNAGLPTDGPGAAPLTARGRAEAERVAAAFAGPPGLIVSSPFVRARETARPTRERFPDVPYEEWPVQEFTFLGALHGPGTTNVQRRPHAAAYWERSDPAYAAGGDGETFREVVARARDLLARLSRRPDGLTAVFTHGLFMRALMWSLTTGVTEPDAAEMRAFARFQRVCTVPNGAVLELRGSGGGPEDLRMLAGSFTHLPAALPAGTAYEDVNPAK